MVTKDAIRQLRLRTSAPILDCKRALEEAGGDLNKAIELLRKRGARIAAEKSERIAKEGRVDSYIHLGSKIGVLVEVDCETDFVARNERFCQLVKDLSLQIAATNPLYIRREEVPKELAQEHQDPERLYRQICLLEQPFIKEETISIGEYLNSVIAKVGENIVIKRFARFEVGKE